MKMNRLFCAVWCTLALLCTACDKNDANEPTNPNKSDENKTDTIATNHQWVDMGLPSGLKWAACNVGANKPEDYGNFYAWGEVETKKYYYWNTYKYGLPYKLTKYCINTDYGYNNFCDGLTRLEWDDDVANMSWGGTWRMPTNEEWEELYNNCIWSQTTLNDVIGYKLVSKVNGNSLFFPAAGECNERWINEGKNGYYWSSTLYTADPSGIFAACLKFYPDIVLEYDYRYEGMSVRAVHP